MSPEAAIQSLPADERQVMTLIKVYGYRHEEIAVRLHMDKDTVARIMQRAVQDFADALEKESA